MKALVCEMCNSNDLVKQDGMYVCQHCGTKYTVEEAKKLMIEGTVKIDKSEETKKLLVLARRAREENNTENAAKYYEKVLFETPDNWEANFFQVYYQASQCTLNNISNASYSVANNINSTMKLISKISNYEEREEALDTVINYSKNISSMFSAAAINHFNKYSTVAGTYMECSERIVATKFIYEMLEKSIKSYLPNHKYKLLFLQKEYNLYINSYGRFFNAQYRTTERNRLTNEIKAQDPSYTPPYAKSGSCYVATAVYGSYDCPQVWTLRRYRDDTLSKTWYGRAFIHIYYKVSPTLVKWFGKTNWFRNMWKPKLDRMVKNLNCNGVENTPYEDKNW